MNSPKFIYVGQMEAFWKLPIRVWIDLCQQFSEDVGYLLPEQYALKRKPRGIQRSDSISPFAQKFTPLWADILYVEPLDWDADAFKLWLSENDELVRENAEFVDFIAYGDFEDPETGQNFIVIRRPNGRVKWSREIVPAIDRLLKSWYRHVEWNVDGEQKGQSLWKTKIANRYLWDGTKLVKQDRLK